VFFFERHCEVTGKSLVTNIPESAGPVVSPEVFLEYDFTPAPGLSLPNRGEKAEDRAIEQDLSNNGPPTKIASVAPAAKAINSTPPVFNESPAQDNPTSLVSPDSLVRQSFLDRTMEVFNEALNVLEDSGKIDEEFISLPEYRSCHGFLISRLTQKSEKPSFRDFDEATSYNLIKFFTGLLTQDAAPLRPQHPGMLLDRVASLDGSEWSLVMDIWSASEQGIAEGLNLSGFEELCFGGSSTLAKAALDGAVEKGFVVLNEETGLISLTDLGWLVMDIYQLGYLES